MKMSGMIADGMLSLQIRKQVDRRTVIIECSTLADFNKKLSLGLHHLRFISRYNISSLEVLYYNRQ